MFQFCFRLVSLAFKLDNVFHVIWPLQVNYFKSWILQYLNILWLPKHLHFAKLDIGKTYGNLRKRYNRNIGLRLPLVSGPRLRQHPAFTLALYHFIQEYLKLKSNIQIDVLLSAALEYIFKHHILEEEVAWRGGRKINIEYFTVIGLKDCNFILWKTMHVRNYIQ